MLVSTVRTRYSDPIGLPRDNSGYHDWDEVYPRYRQYEKNFLAVMRASSVALRATRFGDWNIAMELQNVENHLLKPHRDEWL